MKAEKERVFSSIDHPTRNLIREAPLALVEPTRDVVTEAMRLVRTGPIDSVDRQSVVVRDPVTNQHFSIMDVSVEKNDGGVVSVGNMDGGLFIYAATINKKGCVEENVGDGISAPRHPYAVSQKSIYLLRGIYPDAMQSVATSLRRAEVVDLASH